MVENLASMQNIGVIVQAITIHKVLRQFIYHRQRIFKYNVKQTN